MTAASGDLIGHSKTDLFVEALSDGNAGAAAKILRELECLDGVGLQILADILDDAPPVSKLFPWRLRFVARTAGKPVNYRRKAALDFSVFMAVTKARAKSGNYDQAIAEVKERIEKHNLGQKNADKWSSTRIRAAYSRYLKKADQAYSK
jgi:hypothetical protein